MKAIRLIAAADDFDNTPGLVIKGTESFDGLMADRNGMTLAHDLLEHQNGVAAMGPVWDELEALGGIWYVRGQHSDMMTDHHSVWSPAQSVAHDVARMFGDYANDPDNGPGGLSAGRVKHLYDDDFNEIIEYARQYIPREHTDMGCGDPSEDENGWSPELHELFADFLKLALHRMRIGFRKAQRRFERDGASQWNGHNLFYAVKEAVKAIIPQVEYEGQEFILLYGNGEARCHELQMNEVY